MNILMMSWVAGYLPHPQYQALLCSSGSKGYSAFRRSLEPGYPEHTILITNVDVRDMQPPQEQEEDEEETQVPGIRRPTDNIGQQVDINIGEEYEGKEEEAWSYLCRCTINQSPTPLRHTHKRIFRGRPTLSLISNVSVIPPQLSFEGHHELQSIDLSGMSGGISRVEDRYLAGCRGLKTINLTPFTNKIKNTMPEWFLNDCTGLKRIDLAPLSGITVMSEGFLSGCTGLVSLDFTPMYNVTTLPEWFLEGLTGLKSINLSGFRNGVTELPMGFLGNCTGFESVDLAGLEGVTEHPVCFLKGCTNLSILDLAPLANVTFRQGGLSFLTSSMAFPNLVIIGNPPLSSCCGGAAPEGWDDDVIAEPPIRRWTRRASAV